jgi:Synaptobrevin
MLLQNQEKYDDLLAKSETLTKGTQVFRKKARLAKRRMQVRYYFWSMVSCGIIVVLFYLVLASTCGVLLQRCIGGSGGNDNNKDQGGDE